VNYCNLSRSYFLFAGGARSADATHAQLGGHGMRESQTASLAAGTLADD